MVESVLEELEPSFRQGLQREQQVEVLHLDRVEALVHQQQRLLDRHRVGVAHVLQSECSSPRSSPLLPRDTGGGSPYR